MKSEEHHQFGLSNKKTEKHNKIRLRKLLSAIRIFISANRRRNLIYRSEDKKSFESHLFPSVKDLRERTEERRERLLSDTVYSKQNKFSRRLSAFFFLSCFYLMSQICFDQKKKNLAIR